ncbi:MAG: DUF3467 domain-containing protein [Proteobacteria bacterium]|nr:DUF3467 domain-containing protein [Pseudomonadota bacterium]
MGESRGDPRRPVVQLSAGNIRRKVEPGVRVDIRDVKGRFPRGRPSRRIRIRRRSGQRTAVTHSSDEFILDWLLNSPSGVHLVSRVIVSPSHVKRVINALKENLDKYEKQFGSINETVSVDHKFH